MFNVRNIVGASSSSATPLGMANPTMVETTCGLSVTVYGQAATGDS